MPITVFIQRVISFSPSETSKENRQILNNYNWNLKNLDGEIVNFSQSKGKVVLVNFWATWCPPCVAEMPELQELYKNYKDEVDFYFVSTESVLKLNLFLDKKGYLLPVYIQREKAPTLIETNSLPTTFLISKSGELVIKKTGAASWNSDKVHQIIDDLLME